MQVKPRSFRAVLAVCGLLATCCPLAAQDVPKPLSVVFVNPGKTGEVFWDMVAKTMSAAGQRLGISVETLYAERNHRMMQHLGIEVTKRATRPDFLVLVNEEGAAVPILEAAEASGVKTFLLSNTLVGIDAELYGAPRTRLSTWIGSIVPDMDAAGARMAAALVAKARADDLRSRDGKLHFLAIGGDDTTPTSIARNTGMEREMARAADAVVDRMLLANWNAADAERITGNYLAWAARKGIRVAGIWAGNDPMALGALNAVAAANLTPGKDLHVVGLNWSLSALAEVEQGRMLLTDGGHFLMGGWSMVLLRDYADGCDFTKDGPAVTYRTAAISGDAAGTMKEFIGKSRFDRIDFAKLRAKAGEQCTGYDFSVDAILRVLDSGGKG